MSSTLELTRIAARASSDGLTAGPASVPGSDLESERIEALEEELQELREDLEAERFAVGVHNAKVATLQKALSRRGDEAAKLSAMQEATQLRGRLQDVEQRLAESVAQHAALTQEGPDVTIRVCLAVVGFYIDDFAVATLAGHEAIVTQIQSTVWEIFGLPEEPTKTAGFHDQ